MEEFKDEFKWSLPDQGGKKTRRNFTTGEKVADAITPLQLVPRAPVWDEQTSFYTRELEDAIGAEFVSHDIADQPFLRKNLPKRSSRRRKK